MTLTQRIDAVWALLLTPFVLTLLLLVAIAVAYVARRDRAAVNPYLDPWRKDDREPGQIGGRQ